MEPWYSKNKQNKNPTIPQLQTTTTKNNPTPFLHLFSLPSISHFWGEEERNRIEKARTVFTNLPGIPSSLNSFLDHTGRLFIHFALNNGR